MSVIPISSVMLCFLEQKQTEIYNEFKENSKNKHELSLKSHLLTIFMRSGVSTTVEFDHKQMAPLMMSCVGHTIISEKLLDKYLNGDPKTEVLVDSVAGITIISDGFRLNPSDLSPKELKELDDEEAFQKKYPSLAAHPRAKHMVSMVGFFENATLIRDIELVTAMGKFVNFGLINDQWLRVDEMANGLMNPFAQDKKTLETIKKIQPEHRKAVVMSIVQQVNNDIKRAKNARKNKERKAKIANKKDQEADKEKFDPASNSRPESTESASEQEKNVEETK